MGKIGLNIITPQPSQVSLHQSNPEFSPVTMNACWVPSSLQTTGRSYVGNPFLQSREMVHELSESLCHVLYLHNQIRAKMENCCHFWYRVGQPSLSNLDVSSKASTMHLNHLNITLIILHLKVILFTEY